MLTRRGVMGKAPERENSRIIRNLRRHCPVSRTVLRASRTPEGDRPYDDVLFWSVFASLTGLPATVAPVGLTAAGLPVGVQIMGPYLEDATPIDVAARMAEVTGGFRSPSGYE